MCAPVQRYQTELEVKKEVKMAMRTSAEMGMEIAMKIKVKEEAQPTVNNMTKAHEGHTMKIQAKTNMELRKVTRMKNDDGDDKGKDYEGGEVAEDENQDAD